MVTAIKEATVAQKPIAYLIVLSFCLMLFGEYTYSRYKHYERVQLVADKAEIPPEYWVDFRSLTILDTPQGQDPLITNVDRTIIFERKHTMHWQAAVYNDETGELLCQGQGSSPNYSKHSTITPPITVLGWWLFRRAPAVQCERWPFPVGKTCLYTKWDFIPKEGPLPGPYQQKTAELEEQCWVTLPYGP